MQGRLQTPARQAQAGEAWRGALRRWPAPRGNAALTHCSSTTGHSPSRWGGGGCGGRARSGALTLLLHGVRGVWVAVHPLPAKKGEKKGVRCPTCAMGSRLLAMVGTRYCSTMTRPRPEYATSCTASLRPPPPSGRRLLGPWCPFRSAVPELRLQAQGTRCSARTLRRSQCAIILRRQPAKLPAPGHAGPANRAGQPRVLEAPRYQLFQGSHTHTHTHTCMTDRPRSDSATRRPTRRRRRPHQAAEDRSAVCPAQPRRLEAPRISLKLGSTAVPAVNGSAVHTRRWLQVASRHWGSGVQVRWGGKNSKPCRGA